MRNPIKDSIVQAYNRAVYLILNQQYPIFLKPNSSPSYLSEVSKGYDMDTELIELMYKRYIARYLLDTLIKYLQHIWPIHPEEIAAILQRIDFERYDHDEPIFSERNVTLLTDLLFLRISAVQPVFVSKGDGIGKMIGVDRDLGPVYDNTWIAILIFFLLVFIFYILGTGEMFI